MFEFRQISDTLKPYCSGENIFDYYRLVDPKTHEVFKYGNDNVLITQENKCYEYWDRSAGCPNCISRNSCVKQRQYIKLEFMYGKVLLVFSKPIKVQERMLSLELLKDITSSMLGINYYRAQNKSVENIISQFNELAVRDILTGLYNLDYISTYLEDFLQKEIAFNNLVATVIDIDNYTEINSSYGYNVGNEVLQYIAGIMEKCAISYGGIAARMGPDEMAVFFTNVTIDEIEEVYKKLSFEVESTPFKIKEQQINIGFTYAVTEMSSDDESEDFIGRMYFNLRKAQGRR